MPNSTTKNTMCAAIACCILINPAVHSKSGESVSLVVEGVF